MRLLFCRSCQDLFRLVSAERACQCGETRGRYVNDLDAIYSGGAAVPIGFNNSSFAKAIAEQRPRGNSEPFSAFVIPVVCTTFKKEGLDG